MISLSFLLISSISVHTDLPPELTRALARAIEKQTGSEPEITRHREDEGAIDVGEHVRSVRASTRASTLLIVCFDRQAGRIVARLIDHAGSAMKTFDIELARGAEQEQISLDALARAAFPKLERSIPGGLINDEDHLPPPRAMKLDNAKPVDHGSFELTVELDGRPVR